MLKKVLFCSSNLTAASPVLPASDSSQSILPMSTPAPSMPKASYQCLPPPTRCPRLLPLSFSTRGAKPGKKTISPAPPCSPPGGMSLGTFKISDNHIGSQVWSTEGRLSSNLGRDLADSLKTAGMGGTGTKAPLTGRRQGLVCKAWGHKVFVHQTFKLTIIENSKA